MTFQCPECEHKPFDSLKAWKRHMTSMHQGATGEQLADVMGQGSEGATITGERDLESAIASMPLTEDEPVTIGEDGRIYPAASGESAEEKRLRKQAEKEAQAARKRIQAKFDGLKQRISSDIPEQMLERAGIKLDPKDKQMLADSIEMGMEVIGVQIEVTPYNIPIRNPFWILLYPMLVLAFIIGKAILGGAFNAEQNNRSDSPQG